MGLTSIEIHEISTDQYPRYGAIPNWFQVESVFRVEVLDGDLGGFRLVEEPVAEPFVRDYDSHGDDNPIAWVIEFDLSRWGIFLATDGNLAVGGIAVAVDAPVYPMDRFQRKDMAVVWDIRVHPDHRGRGIGAKLFQRATGWGRGQGYSQLGLETDSGNVAACRFYARQGCELGAIHRFGYAACPEVARYAMLLWYLDLWGERSTHAVPPGVPLPSRRGDPGYVGGGRRDAGVGERVLPPGGRRIGARAVVHIASGTRRARSPVTCTSWEETVMQIMDLCPDDEKTIRQAAALLVEGFKEHWLDAWPDVDKALEEVHVSFGPDRISRVAVDDDGIVLGWIGGISGYSGNAWELHPLVVHPNHRREGIGRALVADLEEQVRERGAFTLHLGTDDEDNMTTLAGVNLYPNVWEHVATIQNLRGHPYEFYQKLGFVIVGVLPDANGPGKPDIYMAKRVAEPQDF